MGVQVARHLHRLSPLKITKASAGMHSDGGGLYLQVTEGSDRTIHRSWIYRYAINGKERHMGLGSLADVGLAEARQSAADARKLKAQRIDPIEARNKSRATAAAAANVKVITFDDCSSAYIAAHRPGWKNPKHAAQWERTLATYVSPALGGLPVQNVDTDLVLGVLQPIWTKKNETASRVRGRIEQILNWATVKKYREGENPARWRGHLEELLAARKNVHAVKHHAALPYAELPSFFRALRSQDSVSARALEFTILTAARTNETLKGTMAEVADRLWTIAGDRMKAGRDHRVPLSDQALVTMNALAPLRGRGDYLFPGERDGRPLSNMAMMQLLKRMGYGHVTVHGFRSTFRDWAAERTAFPSEVVEMALAHTVSDKVEAAYRRGDLFDKRRKLMEAWADYCERGQPSAEVVPLRA
jgi:integrase